LNDWGIHHLHISSIIDADGFVKRGDPIIFAIFRRDAAYLIDMMRHGDWAKEAIVRVIVETWPHADLMHELKGIVGSSGGPTEAERRDRRAHGIPIAVEVDGRVFVPATTLSLAGSSAKASITAGRMMAALHDFEQQFEVDRRWFDAQLRAAGLPSVAAPEFEFQIFDEGFGVVERNSRVAVRLD
jgi:hypothetical protein